MFVRDGFGIVGNTVQLKCAVPFTTFVFVYSWLVVGAAGEMSEYNRDYDGSM